MAVAKAARSVRARQQELLINRNQVASRVRALRAQEATQEDTHEIGENGRFLGRWQLDSDLGKMCLKFSSRMSIPYNIYCDESCHLENDKQPVIVLASVWCPTAKAREIAVRLREIKQKHKLPASFEMKWSKVSPAKLNFYLDIVDYFFDTSDLHFRGLIAEKSGLRHADFDQDHDSWYYKMYFLALQNIFKPQSTYRIYLDLKDTRGGEKLRTLENVLCNNMYDFDRQVLQRVQAVHSHEVEEVQLADVLAGVVSYANRNLDTSPAKQALVKRVRERSRYTLLKTTLLREEKFNIFRWQPEPKAH